MCEVCGRVLDHVGGTGYVHTVGDSSVGHRAVPIPQSEALVVAGRCDFCYADYPEWLVPAREFEVVPGHISSNDWAACNDCAALIEKHQWSALLRRARVSWESRHGAMPPAMEQGLARMYRLLRKHMAGSLQPNPAVASQGSSAAKFGQGWKTQPRNLDT